MMMIYWRIAMYPSKETDERVATMMMLLIMIGWTIDVLQDDDDAPLMPTGDRDFADQDAMVFEEGGDDAVDADCDM